MRSKVYLRIIVLMLMTFFMSVNIEAQILEKLGKKAEKVVNRKLEKKTEEETSKAMDTILGNKGSQKSSSGVVDSPEKPNSSTVPSTKKEEISLYTKSDWVAGENLILFDDYSNDAVGDLPKAWNSNGNGQLITLNNNSEQKWLRLYNRAYYEPDLPKELPENFTIEFDLATYGISKKNTSQTANFYIYVGDGKSPLKYGNTYLSANISPFQDWVKKQDFVSWDKGEVVRGSNEKDIREAILNGAHIGISVKGPRYRMYVNGEKVLDFPRAIREGTNYASILFYCYGVGDDNQNVLISNLRVAEGFPEPAESLFKTGSFSTTAITFDVNSAQLKPEAYGILREISKALKSESAKNCIIIGHTDSDGNDDSNMELSMRRASSVKEALIKDFGIEPNRLTTKGKGETEPITSNNSVLEKAKNRRTEFVLN